MAEKILGFEIFKGQEIFKGFKIFRGKEFSMVNKRSHPTKCPEKKSLSSKKFRVEYF